MVGRMITSIHTLIYSEDPAATRAFLRDILGWPYVEDSGSEPGWLIFGTGPSELGVHPTSGTWEGADFSHSVHHEISLMCDDIVATKADLEARGAVFDGDILDEGFGRLAMLELPGAGQILLYEPRHQTAYNL
jgi:catechol 2,3-dioxygenase-like lactoylglutathione lyase family enzyme